MNIPELSIKRPVFTASLFILILLAGGLALRKLPVDLFPNVTFPVVQVVTLYPGAGPKEVETLISKPLEDEISTLSGIKTLRSISKDSVSVVVAAFNLSTDIKYAEQQIRDKVSAVRRKFPTDVKDPVVSRMDPANRPIVTIALSAALDEAKLFDLADDGIRPKLEQVPSVGLIEVLGGRKREVRVDLDRAKLSARDMSASQVAQRLGIAGKNIPAGRVESASQETSYRLLGEFEKLPQIESTVVSFYGNEVATRLRDVGKVVDTLQEEKSRAFLNGKPALLIDVYKQSGANTVAVADHVKAKVASLNGELKGKATLEVVEDNSKFIRDNVDDVKESILIGIALTILVVFFFLGNGRSTVITGLALPNSLLGAFVLMAVAGFSINIMTLLGLSLAVGLLIDDAIVVRENIFRHMEMGKAPQRAASEGTSEVLLAVVATTLTVLAVFGPISFIDGVVGQFFKEFGLTICFAMIISFFDAITMAPMLSAYVGGGSHGLSDRKGPVAATLRAFDRFQTKLEDLYEGALRFTLRRPIPVLAGAVVLFVGSLWITNYIPKVFLPAQDFGQFDVELELPQGTPLSKMTEVARQADEILRKNPEVKSSVLVSGNRDGDSNVAVLKVQLVERKARKVNTSQFKDVVRGQLKPFAFASPRVKDVDFVGTGMRPFNLNLIGSDLDQLDGYSRKIYEALKSHPALKDVEISHKPGKPEVRLVLDADRAQQLGISSALVGAEVRTQIEGATPAVFRENGREYDIRVRVAEGQRNLEEAFSSIRVPNQNGSLVYLSRFARMEKGTGPATINREDRGRYIRISADMNPEGPGMAAVMKDIEKLLSSGDTKLPQGIRSSYVGDAQNFQELTGNMILASLLGVLFIYFVLASLYESWITPFTIMLVLPLAATGAFFGLLVTGKSLDMFSMIGSVLLLGIATKNSILLVDYAKQLIDEGVAMREAILKAGRTRLRPILMTSLALIAGMLPVAIGLNEASRQRVSMGISVIGGLISSTLLTLVVVPAAFAYIERFRAWASAFAKKAMAREVGTEIHESKRHEGVAGVEGVAVVLVGK